MTRVISGLIFTAVDAVDHAVSLPSRCLIRRKPMKRHVVRVVGATNSDASSAEGVIALFRWFLSGLDRQKPGRPPTDSREAADRLGRRKAERGRLCTFNSDRPALARGPSGVLGCFCRVSESIEKATPTVFAMND